MSVYVETEYGYESGTDANPIGLNDSDVVTFWKHVNKTSDDGCWEWKGHVADNGYGIFSMGTPPTRIRYVAHRVAYFLSHGEDPGAYLVCHKCDNRKCVNPSHLFLGSKGDNHRDALAKGRKQSPAKGKFLSEHPTAFFTVDTPYWEMWALVKEGYRKSYVARAYGVSHQMLNSVIKSIDGRLHSIKKEI